MNMPSFSNVLPSNRPSNRFGPTGFTLVEILVVILIIAIMASLITAVIGNSLNSARSAATRATITKVHRLLEERRQAIARSNLRTETRVVRRSMTATPPITGLNNNATAKVVAIKETMRAQLPQQLDDLSGPDPRFNTGDEPPVLAQLKKINSSFSGNSPSFPSSHIDTTTSSELLYVALTMGTELGSGGTTIEFNSREAVDTDGDGLMELVDGWGKPLRFYRWPTDLVPGPGATPNANARVDMLIGGGNAQLWNKDPDDPVGHFKKWINQNPQVTHYFHAPSRYHVPLVVSAGRDGVLGLNEPHTTIGYFAKPATTDITLLSDSITNRNISIGGN